MDKKNNTLIKHIKHFIQDKAYFTNRALETYVHKRDVSFRRLTLNQHLYNLKTKNILYDAGRGWYSTIDQPFNLDQRPVKKLANLIQKDFPLLEFSMWNSRQLISFFHHLPTRFLSFIYVDPDAFTPLFEHLDAKGFRVYRNPKKKIIDEHWLPDTETVIIRPAVSESPQIGSRNFKPAAIEKILVDFYEENEKLYYTEGQEFERIFYNIVLSNRINIAAMLKYCYRRSRKTLRKRFENLLEMSGESGIVPKTKVTVE